MELESHDLEEFKFMIDVNVIGTFHLIKAALPGMKVRKERGPGSIAIISSQAGQEFVFEIKEHSRKLAVHCVQPAIPENAPVEAITAPPETNKVEHKENELPVDIKLPVKHVLSRLRRP
ncbi:3-ketodihydrosphingosine reductase [Heracleum sosnowskyi]|uniref:3-ketodihydrosphingosine reductase n=1 Tax=Heracleum sosnowskyi TaxID=360622 RepID=A0AAD8GY11_9APIA|nr:3-ketodihydrosphingosine reductase [Heracleum sosnowskyi]